MIHEDPTHSRETVMAEALGVAIAVILIAPFVIVALVGFVVIGLILFTVIGLPIAGYIGATKRANQGAGTTTGHGS